MKPAGGRIRDQDVEEVRRRANLIEVASEYMQVKRAGGGRYKALCPFHAEKTPSFSLDQAKGLYHCFGCAEGGDVFTLVMKLENLSFVEAIERLARRLGVDLRYEQLSPADRAALKRRSRLVEAHRVAVEHFHATLMSSSDAADARRYLQGRGFTKDSVETFQVGFSLPKWDDLVRALGAKGFSDQELLDAGLAGRRDGGGVIDRFRGRVMFPIFDLTGDPVAFGARKLRDDDDGPKYLNSAESPIYKKGQVLYALNWAKNDVVKRGRALVVEGYTDVIALHQAGLRDVVATCGTALGLEHLRTLQRFTQQVVLSLDADDAGGTAAERTYDQLIADAQQMGLSLKVVLMPPGSDPADSVASMGGEAFARLVDAAVPLLEFVLRREARRYAVGDPDEQVRALGACVRIIAKTESEQLQREYVRRVSDWIKVDSNIVFVELDKFRRTGALAPRTSGATVLKRSSAQARKEKEVLKLAIQHPDLAKPWLADVGVEEFSVPTHRAIWLALATGADPTHVADSLDADARKRFHELAMDPVEGEVTEALIAEVFARLKEFAVSRQIEELKGRLQKLNPENDRAEYDRLFAALVELERTKRRLMQGEEEDR